MNLDFSADQQLPRDALRRFMLGLGLAPEPRTDQGVPFNQLKQPARQRAAGRTRDSR